MHVIQTSKHKKVTRRGPPPALCPSALSEGSLSGQHGVRPPEQGLRTLGDLWGQFRRAVDLDGKKKYILLPITSKENVAFPSVMNVDDK